MQILGIAGSLRRGSYNQRLIRAAALDLPSGAALEEWRGLASLPAFSEDLEDSAPAAVQDLRAAISRSDALLIATPEYNASVPGALKNALDWASRPFPDNVLRHKPSLVIGASTGPFGAVWAQAETRKALRASGADSLEDEFAIGFAEEAFADDGRLLEPELADRLHCLLDRLAAHVACGVD